RLGEAAGRRQRDAGGGAGESREIRLGRAGLLEVEPREPQDGAGGKQEDREPVPVVAVEDGEVHDQSGREPERDRVDERIELLAELRTGVRRARDLSIERVTRAAEQYEHAGLDELPARGGDDREDAEEEVPQRESARE